MESMQFIQTKSNISVMPKPKKETPILILFKEFYKEHKKAFDLLKNK